jgi:hypothetical protein
MAGPRTSAMATLALALDPFAKRVWVVKSSQAPSRVIRTRASSQHTCGFKF